MSARAVRFPLRVGDDGTTETVASRKVAVEALLEELLFTDPGERLNRPDLGCGVIELIFDALSDELRTAAQFQILSSLQKWLGDVARVTSVTANAVGTELEINVSYQLAGEASLREATFGR